MRASLLGMMLLAALLALATCLPLAAASEAAALAQSSATSSLSVSDAAVLDILLELENELDDEMRVEAEDAAKAAAASATLIETRSASRSQAESHSQSRSRLPRNHPIVPVARTPSDGRLRFKSRMPQRLWNMRKKHELEQRRTAQPAARLDADTQQSLVQTASQTHVRTQAGGIGDLAKKAVPVVKKLLSKSQGGSGAAASSVAAAPAAGSAGVSAAAAGAGDDWTQRPVWWKPPPAEAVRPWREDDYGYLLRPATDTASNMSPDPFPTLAPGRVLAPMSRLALQRVLHTPPIAGAPPSVHAFQFPGAPPLPELDANLQQQNNYPNAPFYEHDNNRDYIWG